MTANARTAASALGPWEDDPPELNLRLLVCVGSYLQDRHGEAAVARVMRAAGLEPRLLDGKTRWIAAARFEAILEAARAELTSDEELFEASLYRYLENQGLIHSLVTLSSPIHAYERSCEMYGLASRIGRLRVERMSSRKLRFVYTTSRAESRLACLNRMSSLVVTPTLWGLPRARVQSKRCIAEGDEVCEYEVTIHDSPRWLPVALGAVAGGAVTAGVAAIAPELAPAMLLAPVVGALLGRVNELGRVHRRRTESGSRSHELLRQVAQDDADARRELMAMQKRQGEWLELMEEQLAERTAALQEVVQRIRRFERSTRTTITGLSHDLHNPLQVLLMEAEVLAHHEDRLGPLGAELVEEHTEAVRKIQQLLGELMEFVTSEHVQMELAPAPIEVAAVTDRMRRQLRALIHGKPIRASVTRTPGTPEQLVADPMILDRVIDNLLSNAAKYTEDGSIVVEVTGARPGYLTVKIADTGRGMEAAQIERAFVGGATPPADRERGSYGIGLSVVVDLLGRVGGQLEVMSSPDTGTTFWVHVPLAMTDVGPTHDPSEVLTIRDA